MSIKRKLAIYFSIIVASILIVNNVLFYYTTRDLLINDQRQQMEAIAREIGVAIEHSEQGSSYVEAVIDEKLGSVSSAAQAELNPDIEKVTNEQLLEVRRKLNVSHITLSAQSIVDRTLQENASLLEITGLNPNAKQPYVLDLVTDYEAIQNVLNEQMLRNGLISLVLLAVVFVLSYVVAGIVVRPLQKILCKVDDMARGNFEARIDLRTKDELGQLANRVNLMSKNLQVYTEELRSLFEHNPSALFSFSLAGDILTINPAAEQVLGYKAEEVQGRSLLDLVIKRDRKKVLHHFREAVNGQYQSYEMHILRKGGDVFELGVRHFPIVVGGETVGIYSIGKDITESRRTEELLRKSDKLSVVGQLAAGVAHEIRNPLTSIKGFVQLIRDTQGSKPEYFTIMLSELNRIESIINEFLVLAKPQAVNFQESSIVTLLQNITALLGTEAILNNIEIVLHAPAEIPLIQCEENQLKQVFINILKNSIEAMPAGGVIHLDVEHLHAQEEVRVRVVDQGVGIPEERIPKLGEPFYTTKEKGTGLGLMISYKIISEHRGKMTVQSQLNVGTTVEVYLPTCHE